MIASDSLRACVSVGGREEGRGAPNREVAVLVVDERRNAPVRVVLGVRLGLLVALLEVEIHGLVAQAELFEHDCDLPAASLRLLCRVIMDR